MQVLYAPCDCDLIASIGVAGLVVKNYKSDTEAGLAFMHADMLFRRSFAEELPPLARYACIHGPGGHVIAVRR